MYVSLSLALSCISVCRVGEGSYRYQTVTLPGNGVTEVSAIRFLTKDFQYGLFEGFRGRGI